MIEVVIAKNCFEPETWEEFHVEDALKLIYEQFDGTWPETARIYNHCVSEQTDVTPNCEIAVEGLRHLKGPLYVVVYPEYAAIPYIVAAIVAAIVAYAVTSNLPKPAGPKDQAQASPNNDLSDRQNTARPFGRIPDIYGTVRCTPDLLMLPYTEYRDNIEYEHAYMCIGRGRYTVFDALDDTTPITSIDGAQVTIYGPNDSPLRYSYATVPAPAQLPGWQRFGDTTDGEFEQVYEAKRMTSVNGQDLLTDSTSSQIGSVSTMSFHMDPDPATDATITFSGGEDLTSISPGQIVYLYVKSYKTHHTTHDTFLSGNYTVRSCDATHVVLENVQSIANDWGWLQDWPSEFVVTECHMVTQDKLQVGPFLLTQKNQTQVWCNLVATNGMYKVDGSGNVTQVDAGIKAIIQPTDSTGNPIADPYSVTTTMVGDSRKNTIAITWKIGLTTPGPCLITLFRTTASPTAPQVSDAIKWKDLVSITELPNGLTFGNVTTCYSITKATSGALSVKERKLNMLVQRMLPTHVSGQTFSSTLAGTNSAADILCAAALDPYIGNRNVEELNVQQIYDTLDYVSTYFGSPLAKEFNGTFGDDNISYEEIVATISGAVFCLAYRQGNVMSLKFEQKNEDSVLLFNHRNKIPGSETRTTTFGSVADFDCVEYTYTNQHDQDGRVILTVPFAGVNPKQIDSVGIRNYEQAYWQAWREWNKIKYVNTSTTFEATQEAAILTRSDRVSIADNTRTGTQDGYVVAQNVLELQLSQKVTFEPGKSYTIFLQLPDGSVDNITISIGSNPYNVLLARAPLISLALGDNVSVDVTYWIVASDSSAPSAFLVTERKPASVFTENVTAVNYDDRYYANDQDGKTGTMPVDPYLTA